jgi:MFS family permease
LSESAGKPDLRPFGSGLLFGLVAEQTVLFAVPLLVFQNTGSLFYAGLAFALEWLPALVIYPFAGLLADRVGGRRLFIGANLARAISLLLTLVFCLVLPEHSVTALLVNAVLLSLLVAPIRMAVEKTVPAVAGRTQIARCQSLVQNMELVAMALGPALAAALAYFTGKVVLLGAAALAFMVAAGCWRGLPGARALTEAPGRVAADLRLGWQLMLGNPSVMLLGVLNFSINLAFAVVLSANAYVVTGMFKAADGVFGLMNAGAGALGLLNLFLVPRLLESISIYQLGALGFAVLCAGLLGLGLANGVGAYAWAFLLAMAGDALFNVFNRTQRIKVIPAEHLGKVMGPFYLLNLLSFPIGGLITAFFGISLGIQPIVLALALLLALPGSLLLWFTAQRFRLALSSSTPLPECSP